MTDKMQSKVLEHLLDSYEKSKTFQGENLVNQTFSVNIGKLFPRYQDDAEYDYFCRVNRAMEELGSASLVTLEYQGQGLLKKVRLNPEKLEDCYKLLGRMPRRQEQQELAALWEDLLHWEEGADPGTEGAAKPLSCREDGALGNPWDGPARERILPLLRYIEAQRVRIGKNQNVEYYGHDLGEYRDLLTAARAVLENREEVFVRNFSIQLFHDSKRLEQLAPRLEALLYQYGEFQERGNVLEECGVVHTPTYVMMKGSGVLRLRDRRQGKRPGRREPEPDQKIDLSRLKGDLALSTESLRSITELTVSGGRVVTVENLTSFHDYPAGNDFVVYLGGFHNKVKRDFLADLYRQNPTKEYRHFGDLDAGGFYILEHLKRKTGIGFRSLYMDAATLRRYEKDQKPLTENDRKRLQQLWQTLQEQKERGECLEDYGEVIGYMLDRGCKLEQEAVRLGGMEQEEDCGSEAL